MVCGVSKHVLFHLHKLHVLLNGAVFVRGLVFPFADWCFRGCLTELFLGGYCERIGGWRIVARVAVGIGSLVGSHG
jgi:hypothetical protein